MLIIIIIIVVVVVVVVIVDLFQVGRENTLNSRIVALGL